MQNCIKMYSARHHSQFISITSCTKNANTIYYGKTRLLQNLFQVRTESISTFWLKLLRDDTKTYVRHESLRLCFKTEAHRLKRTGILNSLRWLTPFDDSRKHLRQRLTLISWINCASDEEITSFCKDSCYLWCDVATCEWISAKFNQN